MAINPIEILKDTIASVAHTITISSVVSLGGSKYQLNTSNTLYLNNKTKVIIDSVEYIISDFVVNSYVTVNATDGTDTAVTASSFDIDPPLFLWGSPKMVSAELVKRIKNKDAVWPYMWVVEISNTERTLNPASAVKSKPTFNIFLLDSNDKNNWDIETHYDEDIYPLNNYISFFESILISRRDLFDTDSINYDTTNHVNFGDYVVDKGNEEKILNDNVTGIQLRIEIPYTIDTCEDIQVAPKCSPVTILVNGVFDQFKTQGTTYDCITGGSPASNSMNGTELTDIAAGGDKDFIIQYANGDPVVVTTISDSATGFTGSIPDLPLVRNTSDLYLDGQTTSYRTGDNVGFGRGTDWWNLGFDNEFGNGKRFTGTTGGYQDETDSLYYDVDGVATTSALAFPDDIMLDWSQWNQVGETIFGLNMNVYSAVVWNTFIDDTFALTYATYSDWIPMNKNVLCIMSNDELAGAIPVLFDYHPINYLIDAQAKRLWSKTTGGITTRAYYLVENGGIQNTNKTSNVSFLACRIFTYAELGL